MLTGFWSVDVTVDEPEKNQNQLVGLLVLESVKLIQAPSQIVVLFAAKLATGVGCTIT